MQDVLEFKQCRKIVVEANVLTEGAEGGTIALDDYSRTPLRVASNQGFAKQIDGIPGRPARVRQSAMGGHNSG